MSLEPFENKLVFIILSLNFTEFLDHLRICVDFGCLGSRNIAAEFDRY